MIILTLRTDKPEAEIGLFDNTKRLGYITWQAHRELATTLHTQIAELLRAHGRTLAELQGIVCFQGPGSFTGLRIGLSVGNALAYSLSIPVAATTTERWIEKGLERLLSGGSDPLAMPEYGAPANITPPKK